MATHIYSTIAGSKATGGTGGGAAGITSNIFTDFVREPDDNGGSDQNGIVLYQVAGGVSTAYAKTDFEAHWAVSGTAGLRLYLFDDSTAIISGGGGNSDTSSTTKPNAQGGGTADFRDKTGVVDAEQYSRSGYSLTYGAATINNVDGEGFNYFSKGDIYWNGVNVGGGENNFGFPNASWSVGDTHTNGDYKYTIGAYQEVYGGNSYYEVGREKFPLTAYAANSTSGNITGLRVNGTIATASASGGSVAPLRTLNASNIDSTGSFDSGWVTSNLTTGIKLIVKHTPTLATSGDNHNYSYIGTMNLWARALGVNDTIMKTIKFSITTQANVA
jgi:hypothetical protein